MGSLLSLYKNTKNMLYSLMYYLIIFNIGDNLKYLCLQKVKINYNERANRLY